MIYLSRKFLFLMESFSDFITAHENADTSRLILSRDKFQDIDIDLAVNTIEVRRKLRKKVPSWYMHPELEYPLRLSGEQCSSESTAMYKAALVHRISGGRKCRIADLTGGLGVDSWAFCSVADAVLYNEMNPVLAAAARHNFRCLGRDRITVRSGMVAPAGEKEGMTAGEILGDFRPDIIFMDPARRNSDGNKVFLLEQCRPDVLELRKELFRECRYILLKLSPMADISMLLDRLGKECRELHVLESGRECKEIIVLMDREFSGECTCSVSAYVETGNNGNGEETGRWCSTVFSTGELREPAAAPVWEKEQLKPGAVLFEPGKALLKAGAYNILCRRFPLVKSGRFSHYYLPAGDGQFPEELAPFGKLFIIKEVLPLNNRNIREVGKRYPEAEVTARNMKMDTAALEKKLGVSQGNGIHIFGIGCELRSGTENLLLVTETPASVRICCSRRNNGCTPCISEDR